MPESLLTAADVAQRLYGDRARVGRVHELARTGIIPAVRIGRQVRFEARALEEFIASGGRALVGGWRRQPRESLA
jgi:excisionase family DNA binding protein